MCKLRAFSAFVSAEEALEDILALSEHAIPNRLLRFLEMNLPVISDKKKKKKIGYEIGVADIELAKLIAQALGARVRSDEAVRELLRGARQHASKLAPELGKGVLEQAQLGLGHAYSRAKVKYNPARADNMIIQCIGLLDTLDKDINTLAMRCREWYSWHFPELRDLVRDNFAFARAAAVLGDRATFLQCLDDTTNNNTLNNLAQAVKPRGLIAAESADVDDDGLSTAQSIAAAARVSMGMECNHEDMANIMNFTERMVALATYRAQLGLYLEDKMRHVAPNLTTIVGDTVGARLIAKAGSLSSLAKCPASTVQILGAEKALFRALKNKGNTPKYGLIYHSTFVGRATKKDKGRISRYLANKCAIASRIDAFADELTDKYGIQMREQVEERLRFFDTGAQPRKNIDVMNAVKAQLGTSAMNQDEEDKNAHSSKKIKKKKRSIPSEEDQPGSSTKKKKTTDHDEPMPDASLSETKNKSDKKKKKRELVVEDDVRVPEEEKAPGTKKKKKKKSTDSSAVETPISDDSGKKKKKKKKESA